MENNSQDAVEYQQGFNEGYLIAQHLPDLATSLSKIESTSARMEGFKDGQEQLLLEQIREQRINQQDRNKGKDIDSLNR